MSDTLATRPSLLVRLRDPRDGAAWETFVRLYAPLVHGLARRRGLQDADAADLTQEVLATVARALGTWRFDPARGKFRTWLYTVVRTRLSNFLRVRRGHEALPLSSVEAPAAPDEAPWWEEEYRRQVFARAVEQVQPTVEPSTWEAFRRTALEGEPAGAVAGELSLS